jgi:hypothetical protein
MTFLQELGFQKTKSEIYIDEKRPDVDFNIIVTPEDYVNGIKHNPTKSPLAIAASRAIEGSGFSLDRAGFKTIIISRGIYEYGFFMPRRVWRKVNCQEFADECRPMRAIKFKATFTMLF